MAARTTGFADTARVWRSRTLAKLIAAGKTERILARGPASTCRRTKTFCTSPGRGPRLVGSGATDCGVSVLRFDPGGTSWAAANGDVARISTARPATVIRERDRAQRITC